MLSFMILALIGYMAMGTSSIFVGIVFTFAIVAHIFSADDTKPIQMLWTSLPYTRGEIVSARYISALLFNAAVLAVIAVLNLIINGAVPDLKGYLFAACLSMLILSIFFPFTYKFKSKNMMAGGMILFVVYLFTVNFLIPDLHDRIRTFTAKALAFGETQLALTGGVAVVLVYFLSWLLSLRIFKKQII